MKLRNVLYLLAVGGTIYFAYGFVGLTFTQTIRSLGIGGGVAGNDIRWIGCLANNMANMIAGLGIVWLASHWIRHVD